MWLACNSTEALCTKLGLLQQQLGHRTCCCCCCRHVHRHCCATAAAAAQSFRYSQLLSEKMSTAAMLYITSCVMAHHLLHKCATRSAKASSLAIISTNTSHFWRHLYKTQQSASGTTSRSYLGLLRCSCCASSMLVEPHMYPDAAHAHHNLITELCTHWHP